MKLNDYFEREDTPSQNSPVGQVMLKLCEKRPEMSYEEMREYANALILKASGSKSFKMPRVLSVTEEQIGREKLRQLRDRPQGRSIKTI